MSQKIDIAVVGASGYTGRELLGLLRTHPQVRLKHISSRRLAGQRLDVSQPQFFPWDICFEDFSLETLQRCDLVFFATPTGVCMQHAPALIDGGVRVIDLSADFRIDDIDLWQRWYRMEHVAPQYATQAVYGLTEFARKSLVDAQLVANPGCYPTAVSLALSPLVEADVVAAGTIIADCKSGASGAGLSLREDLLFCELDESIHAYGVSGHRHQAEIDLMVSARAPREDIKVRFVPHIMPMHRGMLATMYLRSDAGADGLRQILSERYRGETFINITDNEQPLRTAQVCHTNQCAIAVYPGDDPNLVVIVSAIDNLVKGAAGQAVQNMNCCYGWPESTGLV